MSRPIIHISFLHTAPTHVEFFEDLVRKLAPTLNAAHYIREDLLIDAQQPSIGTKNHGLIMRIKRATKHAADSGARVVVCTCSTIGGVVESLQIKAKKRAVITTRIDRAMADHAVKSGKPILLVAALESTVQPSIALLQSSATAAGIYTPIMPLLVPKAWSYFLAGDTNTYVSSIVNTIAENYVAKAGTHTIVLAQASMHGAIAPLTARGMSALSSPEMGVLHALALIEQHADRQ